MILEAKNLSFCYEEKGRQILNQFSLRADSSERVGIVAPSGFGKTTLCKLLAGYEEPERGEILLDGKQLQSYKGVLPGTDDLAASGTGSESEASDAGSLRRR